MPNDPSLGPDIWHSSGDLSQSWTMEGILHLNDMWTNKHVEFYREGATIPAGTPITMEARLRIASGTPALGVYAPALLGASTWGEGGGFASVWLWPNKITMWHRQGQFDYETDLTQFRAIRIAMTSESTFFVWLDGVPVFSGSAIDPWQNGIMFGSEYSQSTLESSWDYVRYSREYLPVPEPSSLLALGGGLMGLAGLAVRRRRR